MKSYHRVDRCARKSREHNNLACEALTVDEMRLKLASMEGRLYEQISKREAMETSLLGFTHEIHRLTRGSKWIAGATIRRACDRAIVALNIAGGGA